MSNIRFHSNNLSQHPRRQLGWLCCFLLPFLLGGLFFLWVGLKTLSEGKTKDGLMVAGLALVFTAIPVGVFALALRGTRRQERTLREREAHPDQPWLWREGWRTGRVKSRDTASAGLLWLMAVMFLAVPSPALLAIPRELEKGNKPILIALIFPLAGIGLAVAAARATVRRRKFGVSELELHTLPGVIGGTFSGAVTIPAKLRPTDGFHLRLTCVERITTGSGKHRSTHERLLWEEHQTLLREFMEHETDRTGLPLFFRIPADLPESLEGHPAIIWRLEVRASVPGVDYAASFDVPVFRTAQTTLSAQDEPDPAAAFRAPQEAWTPPAGSRIRVDAAARGETVIVFPRARNIMVLLTLVVFTAVWTVFLVILFKNAPLFLAGIWAFFEALLLLAILQMLLYSVRVAAGRGELTIRHSLLLFGWTRRLRAEDIESIAPHPGMQSGTKVYYTIKVNSRAGKKFSAGGGIPDKRHADWLAGQLRSALERK